MNSFTKKRTIAFDDLDRKAKCPRRQSSQSSPIQSGAHSDLNTVHDPVNLNIDVANALAAYLNRAKHYKNNAVESRGSNSLPESGLHTGDTPPDKKPFTYRPLNVYRDLEALRIVFVQKGLDYKQPRSDLQLLSSEALAPHIAKWEDCLTHWHTLMGPDAFSNGLTAKSDVTDAPLFGQMQSNTGQVEQYSEAQNTLPAFGSPISETFKVSPVSPSQNLWPWCSPREPIASKENSSSPNEEMVRLLVQAEVRRHLSSFSVLDARPHRHDIIAKPPIVGHLPAGTTPVRSRRTHSSRRRLRSGSLRSRESKDESTELHSSTLSANPQARQPRDLSKAEQGIQA